MELSRRSLIESALSAAGISALPRIGGPLQAAPAACKVAVADVLSLPEFEERARRCMSGMAYEFVASAAADEHTLRWNREAYDHLALRPRILRDVGEVEMSLQLFGERLAFPILMAPTAYHKVIHPEGEVATARGAAAAGALWVVSSATTTTLEEIQRAARAPRWFQLYVQPDREITRDLVQRAEATGCRALCLTVDTPVLGARNRQARAKFALPPGVTAPYMVSTDRGRSVMNPRRVVVTWKDVEWLRSISKVPLLLKGVLTGEDAELGLQAGADGIIVSNHGARNLDTSPATITALPEVTDAIRGRIPVLVDGGVRRGTDVLKAIALGATAVLIGRPYCFGLSVGGAAGVQRVVEVLRNEFEMAMQLTGRRTLAEIDRSVLWS